MKERKINKTNRFKLIEYQYFIILFLWYGIQIGCNSDNCQIIEYYNNKIPKLEVCLINKQKEQYSYKEFYKDGNIKALFCLKEGKIEGEFIKYYSSGKMKSKNHYKNGERNGEGLTFLKDGKLDYYNYFANDQPIYSRTYYYNLDTLQESEGFTPIINLKQDMINEKVESLEFDLYFPLPDSLLKNRKLFFAYEMKPLSLKDSVILYPSNEILLDNKKSLHCSIKLTKSGTQIFYGHTIDKKGSHIFLPFEKVITVIKKENIQ